MNKAINTGIETGKTWEHENKVARNERSTGTETLNNIG